MTQYISTSPLLWIIIKTGSSLDHHQSWIITGSSSKPDHHWIIIITTSSISINWCYLKIILFIGSSTKPSLFHVGCRPSLHVGLSSALISDLLVRKAQYSHPSRLEPHPTTMMEDLYSSIQAGTTSCSQ